MISGLVSGVSCYTMLFDGCGADLSIAFEGRRGEGRSVFQTAVFTITEDQCHE